LHLFDSYLSLFHQSSGVVSYLQLTHRRVAASSNATWYASASHPHTSPNSKLLHMSFRLLNYANLEFARLRIFLSSREGAAASPSTTLRVSLRALPWSSAALSTAYSRKKPRAPLNLAPLRL
jgi:hypothetical protein